MASGSLTAIRSHMDHNRLPPLDEAVPEIRRLRSTSGHPSPQQARSYYESARGPSQFPEACSLAPSPILASRSRSSYGAYPPQPSGMTENHSDRMSYTGQPASDRGSSISSGYSESQGSYASSTSPISLTRDSHPSPAFPAANALYPPSRAPVMESRNRDLCSLPPIYSHCDNTNLNAYSNSSSTPLAHHEPVSPYSQSRRDPPPARPPTMPGYSNGRQPPDYPYATNHHPERPFNGCSTAKIYHPSFDGDYGDGKQKRRRGNLPKAVTDTLRLWFTEHVAHPYPTEEEKQFLMSRTGLTISQISNWFINARRRSLPQLTKQAQAEAELRDNPGSIRHLMKDDD